jgi:hypothetical protein
MKSFELSRAGQVETLSVIGKPSRPLKEVEGRACWLGVLDTKVVRKRGEELGCFGCSHIIV